MNPKAVAETKERKKKKGRTDEKKIRGTHRKTLTLQPEVFAELDIILKTHVPNEPCHDRCVLLAQGSVCEV